MNSVEKNYKRILEGLRKRVKKNTGEEKQKSSQKRKDENVHDIEEIKRNRTFLSSCYVVKVRIL